MTKLLPVFAAVLASWLVGCAEEEVVTPVATEQGTPVGAAVTATIGAAGGELATADARFTIVVPPGALASDTSLSIQPITNTAHGGVGTAYELTPDGLAFAQPVTLRFKPSEEDLEGSALEFVQVDRQDSEGFWEELETSIDATSGTVSASTPHFSHYSPTLTVQVRPPTSNVEIETFKAFEVWICSSATDDSATGRRTATCKAWTSNLAAQSLGDWSVNGKVGGDSTVGTATYTGPGTMSYEAPAEVPSDNPVKVSVTVRNIKNKPVAPISAKVRITGKGQPYTGTATWETPYFDIGDGVKVTANLVFTVEETLTNWTDYTVSGAAQVEYRSTGCTPLMLTLPIDTNPINSSMTVFNPGAISMNYHFDIETQFLDQMMQCEDGNGPYTREVFVGGSLSCGDVPYSDAAVLSGADESKCSGSKNVSWTFSRQ